MAVIDIYSGFLGAGKTTLIKKLLEEAYKGKKVALIENEFGAISVDSGFLKDAGVQITELNAGCICCSLTGDFREALNIVENTYHPDRIIIEPSGVGKLSEVATAVMSTGNENLSLGGLTTVVDAGKCKMYMKNFGEFFDDQVGFAHTIILSRTQYLDEEKLKAVVAMLKEKNPEAEIITADWDDLDGAQILAAVDGRDELSEALHHMIHEHLEEEECDDPDCECHHHHHDDDYDDDDEHEHEHHHHHEHHEHHHHHHGEDEHDADDVFESLGEETSHRYTEDELEQMLLALEDQEKYGMILRAKGIVENANGGWIHFDYTPGEIDIRTGSAATHGIICVIGHDPEYDAIEELFKVD